MQPFAASWHRIDRSATHRKAAADARNEWIKDEPYTFVLTHNGEGHHTLRVVQQEPTPPEMSVCIGEWLYNLRCALDYAVYDAAICESGEDPPPGEGVLQFPIYFDPAQYRNNEYRLKPLSEQHRAILEAVQPYRHDDPDTSALGWLHKLARIDRHRTLHLTTAYVADLNPVVGVPEQCTVEFGEMRKRCVLDGEAEIGDFTVSPWQDGWEVEVNPRTGLDPELADWRHASPFWRDIPYNDRLRMIQLVVETTVAVLEYECTGWSRRKDFLSEAWRIEADERREARRKTVAGSLAHLAPPPPVLIEQVVGFDL